MTQKKVARYRKDYQSQKEKIAIEEDPMLRVMVIINIVEKTLHVVVKLMLYITDMQQKLFSQLLFKPCPIFQLDFVHSFS